MVDLRLSNCARADIRRDAERNAEGATVGDTLRLLDDCEALIAENERLRDDVKDHADARAHYCGVIGEMAGERDNFRLLLEGFGVVGLDLIARDRPSRSRLTGEAMFKAGQAVREERDQLRAAHAAEQRRAAVLEQNCAEMAVELERAREEGEALRKHLAECADSLESEILDRYGSSKDHPAMRRKFECDMQDVIEARAALGKGGRADA
ncbi:hypothetical protein V2S84_02710 [Azotobacter chroococcum]|nr:hypothetical protein [Azotobacter chroococcum]